jgi:hypothetical protein
MRMLKTIGLLAVGAGLAVAAQSGAVSYGKYLVEEVAKCQDCHTPRSKTGEFDKTKWLKGAMVDFQPDQPTGEWRALAPDVTSSGELFSRWHERGMVEFLETGVGPTGHPSHPPMPAYKLRPHDAEAIVAYLKSLK